ncbi:hypothetical protein Dimus_008720 [Dionaea muscipula]
MLVKSLLVSDDPLQREIRRVCVSDFQQLQGCKGNKVSEDDYVSAIKEEIEKVVQLQEELDIDVLVHGEPERNDTVEYFGDDSRFCLRLQIDGFNLMDPVVSSHQSSMVMFETCYQIALVIKDEVEDLEKAGHQGRGLPTVEWSRRYYSEGVGPFLRCAKFSGCQHRIIKYLHSIRKVDNQMQSLVGKFLVYVGGGGPCRVWDMTSLKVLASFPKL